MCWCCRFPSLLWTLRDFSLFERGLSFDSRTFVSPYTFRTLSVPAAQRMQSMMLLPACVLVNHLGFIKEHISSWPQSSISHNENCSRRSFSLWLRFGWWNTDKSCMHLRSVRIWHLSRSHGCSVVSICLRQIYTCAIYFIVNLWAQGFLFFGDNVSSF